MIMYGLIILSNQKACFLGNHLLELSAHFLEIPTFLSLFSRNILSLRNNREVLDRRLPERERLNVTSWPHVRGQPQNLCFQVCFERLNFRLNA